jgi:hypothetical protein
LGPQAWQELIAMERDIRKQRKETLYAQREARKHFVEAISITGLVIVMAGFFFGLIWLMSNRGAF